MTLYDHAIYIADDLQEWERRRDQWQAKLIKAFHAVENGDTDPFAGDNDPIYPVPDYIRRDFVDFCKRDTYVIDPDTGIVWDTEENYPVIEAFISDNYDPAILTTDCLLEQYYNYHDRRELLIKAIESDLQDLTKNFGDYLCENYGIDTDKPLITDQVLNFVICSVTKEALLTHLEHDFENELFDEWAREFTQD